MDLPLAPIFRHRTALAVVRVLLPPLQFTATTAIASI